MDKTADGTVEFAPAHVPYVDPDPRLNLVAGPTLSPTTTTSSSFVAVLLAGISLLVGTVVHIAAFFLPRWFGESGLWDHPDYYSTVFVWLRAVKAMETIGLIASILTCVIFILLLIRPQSLRQVTLDLRNTQEMGRNPLCGLSSTGRIFLVLFVALMFLAGLSIIIGLVIIICNAHSGLDGGSRGESYASILSGFSGFTFLIGATLAAVGVCEILFKGK